MADDVSRSGTVQCTVCANAVVDDLVQDIIGKVADKWTLLLLEALEQGGTMRFTELGKSVGGISQKMLTKTLRQMEEDGFVKRTVHPVIPPHVDYALTPLGESLGEALCSLWLWAGEHHEEVENARRAFRDRKSAVPDGGR